MRTDTNSKHTQWFYFKVINQNKGSFEFTIHNFYKSKSSYLHGMKPYIKSKRSNQGWSQQGRSIVYEKDEVENCYQLRFTYDFEYPNDEVQFAYCIPYTYSKLQKHILKYQNNYPLIFKKESLCESIVGYDCPLLTITNPSENTNKKVLFSIRPFL